MRRFNLVVPGFTEPDLRAEIDSFLDGGFPEVSKKQTILLRKMRTPLEENKCSCVDSLTLEPDKDHFCPYCMGEGQYWDESFVDTYRVVKQSDVGLASKDDLIGPGMVNVPVVIFYMRASIDVSENDRIIEMELDKEGDLELPYKRRNIYRISTLLDLRSDYGRLEYWKIACFLEQYKFLNGPRG